jgi:hypothetical protein
MRLLLDAHLSHRVAEALRKRGHDAVAADEIEAAALDDQPLWELAIEQGRVLATYDKGDFAALFQQFWTQGVHHHGLVLLSSRGFRQNDFGRQVRALDSLLQRDEDLTDQLIYLRPPDA